MSLLSTVDCDPLWEKGTFCQYCVLGVWIDSSKSHTSKGESPMKKKLLTARVMSIIMFTHGSPVAMEQLLETRTFLLLHTLYYPCMSVVLNYMIVYHTPVIDLLGANASHNLTLAAWMEQKNTRWAKQKSFEEKRKVICYEKLKVRLLLWLERALTSFTSIDFLALWQRCWTPQRHEVEK